MDAKLRILCEHCGSFAEPGDRVWPVSKPSKDLIDDAKTSITWLHFACAESAGLTEQRPQCKHWSHRGRCQFGDSCAFSHDAEPSHLDFASHAGASWPHDVPQPLPASGGRRRRPAVKKISRASVLRRLLIDELGGEDALRAGRGVLDVAGGGGDLSFELVNLNDVACTCVDPRPLGLRRALRTWEKGFHWFNPVWRQWNGLRPPDVNGQLPKAKLPRQLQLLFDDDLTRWARQVAELGLCPTEQKEWLDRAFLQARRLLKDDGADANVEIDADQAYRRPPSFYPTYLKDCNFRETVTSNGRAGADGISTGDHGASEKDQSDDCAEEVTDALEVAALLTECSTIVGLHADQPTGHIVEYAVASGKAFVVVPCCVYPSAFPHRKLSNGAPVKTRAQLIEYLTSLRPGIRTKVLDFEGQNVAVYWSPLWSDDV